MNLFLLIIITTALATIGFVVARGHSKTPANIVFFLLIIVVIGWAFSNYLSDTSSSYFLLYFWNLLTFCFPAFFVWFLLIFSKVFASKENVHRKRLLIYSFLPNALVQIFILSKQIVRDIEPTPQGTNIIFGPLAIIYVAYFFLYLSISLIFLFNKRRKSSGVSRTQISYLLVGLTSFIILASTTNLIIPFIWNIFWPAKYGPYFSTPFIFSTTYAIIRHRLLDIRLVISRSILYVLLVAFVSFLFTLSIFLSGRYFSATVGAQIGVTILAALVIVFGLDPLKKYIAVTTDKFLFKAPIDYTSVLRVLSERISIEIELGELTHELSSDVTRELKLHHTEILLADDKGSLCRWDAVSGALVDCIPSQNELAAYLGSRNKIVERDGLERRMEDTKHEDQRTVLGESLKTMDALLAAIAVPITAQGKMNAALLLGKKLSGDAFSNEELRLLTVLGPQIGSAIQKAKLYEEVKSFTVKLQIEVDRATKELKERNRFLVALQDLTSLITHSLDYKKVTQEIVDGIAKKLGYIGGILMLFDKRTGVTWAEAVTETALTKMAFKLLPIPISSFRGNIADPDLASQAMRSGHVTESSNLADFLNPPIPTAICRAMQAMTHIKHIVAVPIVSEDEIIGCIVYTIGKEKKDISNSEEAMMKALANQAGIVIHNLHLFEQIEKANNELGAANDHLRVLDEAKSEFISIASHQLRTPMTGIMGYLSMLVGGDFGKLDPSIGKILENILGASKRMIRLINIFLNISKIEAGSFEIVKKPTQIEDIVETEFVELAKLAKDKGLTLIFDKPKQQLALISLDRDKLSDVIQNLIDNAIKYTDRGSVTVRTEIFGSELIVRVADTGRGIPKDQVDKLFNKFVRGDGIARIHPDGSGLGLFIAKKIVESHGGRIWVESEGEGKGSTFAFAIPVREHNSVPLPKPMPVGVAAQKAER